MIAQYVPKFLILILLALHANLRISFRSFTTCSLEAKHLNKKWTIDLVNKNHRTMENELEVHFKRQFASLWECSDNT